MFPKLFWQRNTRRGIKLEEMSSVMVLRHNAHFNESHEACISMSHRLRVCSVLKKLGDAKYNRICLPFQ